VLQWLEVECRLDGEAATGEKTAVEEMDRHDDGHRSAKRQRIDRKSLGLYDGPDENSRAKHAQKRTEDMTKE
jgi:hypothetical protein